MSNLNTEDPQKHQPKERSDSAALLDLVIFGFLNGAAAMASLVALVTTEEWGRWLVIAVVFAVAAEIQRRTRGLLI